MRGQLEDRIRFWGPVALLLLFAGYVGQKLVRSHTDDAVEVRNYSFTRPLPALRGSIYGAGGAAYPLVKSIPVWDYHLDPVSLTTGVARVKGEKPRTREAILRTVSKALKIDYRKLLKMANDASKRYQPLGESSDSEAHRILADSSFVRGIAIDDRQDRQYLYGRLMSHVIGAVNVDRVGLAGVELSRNKAMTGTPGEVQGLKDALGRELYDKRSVSVAPTAGDDIYLTLDHNIQFEAESALAWGIREYGAGSGWCIVMDAKSAAILAMASNPDFDPRAYGKSSDRAKVNRACAFTYEPGSVMKVITASAAIDCGFASPKTVYSTNRHDERYYKLPGDGSHKWEPTMTVADAIVHSSNIVIGKLGYDLGRERLHGYMKKFGFGAKTGLELPGEETGILPPWKRWDKASWSRAPIGQYVAVTAIQLCSAYQAIANDGVRMQPHLIDRIVNAAGEEVYRYRDKELGRPISAATARTMREVMRPVASPAGTARRAALKGYSVAGKTGTAQKSAGKSGYLPGLYRATFCGMVPAGDPKIVVLVTLDFDAKTKFHQGGNSSGPVFRRLATAVLRYLMVPPDCPEQLEDEDDQDDELDQAMDARAQGARSL